MAVVELRLLASEVSISVEAALAAAEQIACHGIVESNGFESLMTLLEEAASAAERIKQIVDSGNASALATDDRDSQLLAISNPRRLPKPRPANTPPLRLVHTRDG